MFIDYDNNISNQSEFLTKLLHYLLIKDIASHS